MTIMMITTVEVNINWITYLITEIASGTWIQKDPDPGPVQSFTDASLICAWKAILISSDSLITVLHATDKFRLWSVYV